MSNKFNYWALEHYEIKVVAGGKTSCMRVFYHDTQQYPTRLYGTHIWSKSFDKLDAECEIVIKRFKTKELCKLHTEYPCTYIRKGKML